jgi:hypothetical protein
MAICLSGGKNVVCVDVWGLSPKGSVKKPEGQCGMRVADGGRFEAYAVFNDIQVLAIKIRKITQHLCQDNRKLLNTMCFYSSPIYTRSLVSFTIFIRFWSMTHSTMVSPQPTQMFFKLPNKGVPHTRRFSVEAHGQRFVAVSKKQSLQILVNLPFTKIQALFIPYASS